MVDGRLLVCRADAGAGVGVRHRAVWGSAVVRPGVLQPAAVGVCQAGVHPGAGAFPQPPGRGGAGTADFLEGPRADDAAVRFDTEGAGPRLGAGAGADGIGDVVRGGHAATVSGAAVRRRRPPGCLGRGGRALHAVSWAGEIGRSPAAPAAGVLWQRIYSASRCVEGGARTPAQTTV